MKTDHNCITIVYRFSSLEKEIWWHKKSYDQLTYQQYDKT
jgi:hypothetical protein